MVLNAETDSDSLSVVTDISEICHTHKKLLVEGAQTQETNIVTDPLTEVLHLLFYRILI